jgi:hypothetical protein
LALDWSSSISSSTAPSGLLFLNIIQHSSPPTLFRHTATGIELLNYHRCSSYWIATPQWGYVLSTPFLVLTH